MLKKITLGLLFCLFVAINKTGAQCSYSATISGSAEICLFEITNLDISFSGGIPPYQIDLFTGASIFTINNYFPGQPISVSPFISTIYTLFEVRDAQGCQAELFGEAAITVIQLPSAFPTEITQCEEGNGLSTFDLTAVEPIINGATGLPVSWYVTQSLSNPITNPSNYTINTSIVYARIFDGVCYSGLVPVTLTVVDVPVGQSVVLEACDEGNGTGVFDLTSAEQLVNLGTSNAVSWYEDALGTIPISNPGNYVTADQVVYAIVADGTCESPTVAVSLELIALPVPVISGELLVCDNSSTTLTASAGFNIYQWSNGSTTQNITVNNPGVYTVTVSDNNGCIGQSSVIVEQLSNPIPTISGPSEICEGETIILNAEPGFIAYSWSNGANSPNISVNMPGVSEVTVVDASGCAGSSSFEVVAAIELTCSQTQPDTGTLPSNGIVQIIFSGGIAPYTLSWEGASMGSLTLNSAGPLFIPNLKGGTYTMTIEDDTGCIGTCAFEIWGAGTNFSCMEAEELSLSFIGNCNMPVFDHFILDNFTPIDSSAIPLFTGCQGDSQMDANLYSAWYKINSHADSLTIRVLNGLNTPNLVLYEGTNCSNLIPIACASAYPGSGEVTLGTRINNGDSYYLQIAGGDSTDQNIFELQIESKKSCGNECRFYSDLQYDPAPANGQFQPGQNVQFCYTLFIFYLNDFNWLHALEFNFGNAWDLSSLNTFPPPACSIDDGFWDWYPYWISNANGQFFGPGFAFESDFPVAFDDNPGNNFGDGQSGCANSGHPFQFCWTMNVKDCIPNSNNNDLSFHIKILGDGTSGGYNVPGCVLPVSYYFLASDMGFPLDLGPDLTLCQGDTHTINATVPDCPGCTYAWSNGDTAASITVSESGTYSVTVVDPEGCEAVDDIQLTFQPPTNTDLSVSICEGESFNIGGQVFTQSGFYNLIFTSSIGCDSVVSLELIVLPETFTFLNAQICEGEVFLVGNNTYDQAGQYQEVLTSSAGCDSIIELSLTVFPTYNTALTETICDGQTITFGGNTYAQTGTYQEVLFDTNGCDSIVSLDLTVLDAIINMIDTTILQGESVNIGDSTYDQEGIYYDTLFSASAFGCDSIIITDLSILITECNSAGTIHFESTPGSDTIFLCFGDTLKVRHNGDFDLSGDPDPTTAPGIGYAYYDCPPDTTGPTLTNILADLCLNHTSPIIVNGNPVIQSNYIWVTTGSNANGDMDIVNDGLIQEAFNGGTAVPTQLWLAPITLDDFANTAFESDGNGNTGPCVSVSTVEAFSVVWLNEMVISNLEADLAGCGASFQVNGGLAEWDTSNYSISITKADDPNIAGEVLSGPATHNSMVNFTVPESGLYDILVEDGKSCPAIASIDISMHEVEINIQQEISCFGEADGVLEVLVSINGNVIGDLSEYEILWSSGQFNEPVISGLSAGQYSVTVTNPLGCFAEAEIVLEEPDLLESETTASICEGEFFQFGTEIYEVPGIYTETFITNEGCDSIITLILEVFPAPTVQIDASGTSICSDESVTLSASGGISYHWSTGETTSQITVAPQVTSTYTVFVTDESGCEGEAEITIQVFDQPDPLVITCVASSTMELTFGWNAISTVDSFQIFVSNGVTEIITETNYTVAGLSPLETISIEVFPIFSGPCLINSASFACATADCPAVILELDDPGFFCDTDLPFQLSFSQTGGTVNGTYQWEGPGIIDPSGLFDPTLTGAGNLVVTLTYFDGPCVYSADLTLTVFPTPTASFNLENKVCLGETGTITFQGQAGLNAVYNWDFDGGTAVPGIGPGPHEISWSIPGLKTVSLSIEENGCIAETFSRNIEIETVFPAPNISCIGINDQLAFGWPLVPGATGYDVNVLSGQEGILNGNIFIVSNLEPGEEVILEVIAINGGAVCDDSANTLSCTVDNDPILMLSEPVFEVDDISNTIQLKSENAPNDSNDLNDPNDLNDLKGPYPNPTKQEATIELSLQEAQPVQMTLIDITGRTLQLLSRSTFEKGKHFISIDTQDLIPGLYLVKVKVGDQIVTKKLAVVR